MDNANFSHANSFYEKQTFPEKRFFLRKKTVRPEKMTFLVLMRSDAPKENLPTYCREFSSKKTDTMSRNWLSNKKNLKSQKFCYLTVNRVTLSIYVSCWKAPLINELN